MLLSEQEINNLRLSMPYLNIIEYTEKHFVGIICNMDDTMVYFYQIKNMPSNILELFVKMVYDWFHESNREFPINLYYGDRWDLFKAYRVSFLAKEAHIIAGPIVCLGEHPQMRKSKKRTIQIISE